MFYLIFFGLPVLNAAWWLWAHHLAKVLPRAKLWRAGIALFGLGQLVVYLWTVLSRTHGLPAPESRIVMASSYIWHLLVLPILGAVILVTEIGLRAAGVLRKRIASPDEGLVVERQREGINRRQFLTAAAVAAGPTLMLVGNAKACADMSKLRVRRIDVPIAGLPEPLDGMSIAHVSDTHVGKFTSGTMLKKIAQMTNGLRADLVLMTGDLIDFSLDYLPDALEMLRSIDPGQGLFLCEGNHDLFHGREQFETGVLAAGFPLLLNESRTIAIHGTAVQLLGLKWGATAPMLRNAQIESNLSELMGKVKRDAFNILLAHHPHAFDGAAEAGIPLTLAGHTHGGQLMITDRIGAGPAMFRYWSGLYRKSKASLVVSNGAGNWFPLRSRAPAEIVQVVLHRVS